MVKKAEYRSTIKSRPFLFLEAKKVASLINNGFMEFEIKEKAVSENVFQVNTKARKKEIASIVLTRLKVLDDYLIEKVENSDSETSKMIVLYAIMKTDRLFFEFMYEVYREKFILRESYITDQDFKRFFDYKRQQSEKIASWKEYTFYKLQQVYIRILFEAGLLKNQKGDREIIGPLLDVEVKKYIQDSGDKIYMDILAGE